MDESPITVLQSNLSNTNYTLTNLRPYQLVKVQVSASTAAGEGPMSEPAMGRAREEGNFPYIFIRFYSNFSSLADILPPDINIIVDGMPVAGQTLTLLCRVTAPDGLIMEPQITWRSPQGNILSSEGEVTVGNQPVIGNPSRLTTYTIQFSPLLTSHGGTYTCQATVNSPYLTIQQSAAGTWNVSVQSEVVDTSLLYV